MLIGNQTSRHVLNRMRRLALAAIVLSFTTIPGKALAQSGAISGQPTPTLLTVFSAFQWSNIGQWTAPQTATNVIPANAKITGVLVSWQQESFGGSGVHVGVCLTSPSVAMDCVLDMPNGQFVNHWNGQTEFQPVFVAFYVTSLQFPGNPFNVGITNMTVEYSTN